MSNPQEANEILFGELDRLRAEREIRESQERKKILGNHLVYSLNKIRQMFYLIALKMKNEGKIDAISTKFADDYERYERTIEDIEIIMTKEGMLTEDFDVDKIDYEEDLMDQ